MNMSEAEDYELLWSPWAASRLRDDQADREADEFFRYLGRSLSHNALVLHMENVAAEVEPYDPVLGYGDGSGPTASAFLLGSLPAIHLTKTFLMPEERARLLVQEAGIYIPSDESRPEYAEEQARSGQAHMELAGQGWRKAEQNLGDLFGEWVSQGVVEVRHQLPFQSGYGFVVYMAMQAQQELLSEELEALATCVADDEYDIDAQLRALLSGED